MHKPALVAAAIFGMLAVIIGAFGAHGLEKLVKPDQLSVWQTGVSYQFYHTFALLAAGIIYTAYPARSIRVATTFFALGILLFSGSLYLMVGLSIGQRTIGPIGVLTPIGGLCFIIGWLCLLVTFLKKK